MTRPAESSMLTRNISGQSEKSLLEIIRLNQDRTGEAEWEIMIFTFFKGRLFDQIEETRTLCQKTDCSSSKCSPRGSNHRR